MADFHDDDLERRALYGCDCLGKRAGWFDSLFEEYALYPNLNILKHETRDLFFRKNLLQQVTPVFAKGLTITNLVNSLIHFDLFASKSDSPGMISEIAQIILSDIETKRTLESRIRDKENELSKHDRYFCGLTYSIFDRLYNGHAKPAFTDSKSEIEGSLVAVEGVLNHVDTVRQFDSSFARFDGSGVSWILSDFPYFSMTPDNALYKGDVLGLSFDPEFENIISGEDQCVPFSVSVGWYPYVVVFGRFVSALSPKYSFVKAIEWSWMRFRRPKDPNTIASMLPRFLEEEKSVENNFEPWLNLNEGRHVLLFLGAIQLAYASYNLGFDAARPDIKELAKKILPLLKTKRPSGVEKFFGS